MTEDQFATEDHLTDGWEPEAPIEDTLLRQFVFSFADYATSLVDALGGRTVKEDEFALADLGHPCGFANSCVLLKPVNEGNLEAMMPQINRYFDIGGQAKGMALVISAWPTADLRPFGWSLMGHPPVHLRPAGGVMPTPKRGFETSEVTTMSDLLEWERTALEAYPIDEMLPVQPGSMVNEALLADRRHRFWIARLDGQVVGASAAFVEHGINDVTLVATRPQARGRGIGSALTWLATMAAPSLPATLVSSDEGRPVYQQMGYLPITRMTFWYRLR